MGGLELYLLYKSAWWLLCLHICLLYDYYGRPGAAFSLSYKSAWWPMFFLNTAVVTCFLFSHICGDNICKISFF